MKADTNKSKESNKEKFLKLVSDEKVDTVERNRERIKNRDMTRLSQSIALKVLNRLDVLNWSNEEFADEMGITLDEVKKIISGKTNLTLDVIAKIQKVLNISILHTKPFDQIISDLDTYKERAYDVYYEKLKVFKDNNPTYSPDLIACEPDENGFTFIFWECEYNHICGISTIYVNIDDI